MMRRSLILAMMILSLAGCSRDKPGKDLITPENLVPVLIDMHLVSAVQSSMMIRELSREVDSIDTYSYIFEKHDINRVQFDSTIAWYSRHPKQFTDIYDQVVMELTRISDSLNLDLD